MQQVRASIEAFRRADQGVLDTGQIRGHILKLLNGMKERIRSLPPGLDLAVELKNITLLLAGFDWRSNTFRMFKIYFSPRDDRFIYGGAHARDLMVIGDDARTAKRSIMDRTRALGKDFDLEPLEVLREMSLDAAYPSIGGPPQLVKLGRHGIAMPYCVYWPDKATGELTFLGRPLEKYERYVYRQIDAATLAEHDGYTYTW